MNQPENLPESSDGKQEQLTSKMGAPLMVGSFSIDDAIAMHLVDCDQCRLAITVLRPVGLGQKSGLCDSYWELQLMRAEYEGMVNGITAHTEYGQEAPIRGRLQ